MSRATDNLETLKGLVQAFNAHVLDRVMRYFAEDCSLDMPRGKSPWGTRCVGRGQVRTGLRTRFEMLPDVHYGEDRRVTPNAAEPC
jgi:SnoaL-like domain